MKCVMCGHNSVIENICVNPYCSAKDDNLINLPEMPTSIKGDKCQTCGALNWGICNMNDDWSVKECDKCPHNPKVGPQ